MLAQPYFLETGILNLLHSKQKNGGEQVKNNQQLPYISTVSNFDKLHKFQVTCFSTSDKGMVRSDMSKPALIFFSLQEYTQQNTLSKF
jgi:hypothetical protein